MPTFGGSNKCATCAKSVYKEEELVFEGLYYHSNGCFTCSICKETIASLSKAGSMNGKVSHRLCFEKQMRTSGGKYGGESVVLGAQAAINASKGAAPAAAATAPAAAAPKAAAAAPAAAAAAVDVDDADAAFYAKKKAQKDARLVAETLWGDIVAKAAGTFGGDDLQDMWDSFDADRSGSVDAAELTKLIGAITTAVGASVDIPKVVAATITCMDADGDGALTWNEFVHLSVIQQMGDPSTMSAMASKAAMMEEAEEDNGDFYAKKKAQKAARLVAEDVWGDIVDKAKGGNVFNGDDLQDMWDDFDADRSGNVDAAELTKLIEAIVAMTGASVDVSKVVEATITCMDADGDGALTWNEFVHMSVIQQMDSAEKMRAIASRAAMMEEAAEDNADFYVAKREQKRLAALA